MPKFNIYQDGTYLQTIEAESKEAAWDEACALYPYYTADDYLLSVEEEEDNA